MSLKSNKEITKSSWPLSWKILLLSIGFVTTGAISSYVGWKYRTLTLNENQVLYLFSTSSQVISAIYGLTLTGLVFFINELNREQIEDDTREASTRELKNRYYRFLVFITILVCTAIGIGNSIISTESIGPGLLNSILINAGQTAFAFSLIAIVIFIFEVIDPKALERASDRIKENLDPSMDADEQGSLGDFIRNFNEVERILVDHGQAYEYSAVISPQARARKRLPNWRLAEVLFKNNKISEEIFAKIRELITIRNSIVHGANPVVSHRIVKESEDVLRMIKDRLEPN